jgi:hypothetical protein
MYVCVKKHAAHAKHNCSLQMRPIAMLALLAAPFVAGETVDLTMKNFDKKVFGKPNRVA